MTRVSVNRTLARLYWLLGLVLLLLLASKFANDIPGIPPFVISAANNFYDFMRDMSLLIATGGVAYISNIYQKRSNFVESLEEEWRNIVRTKSVLLSTCEKPYLATDDYLAAYYKVSETIDTMRIVYRNAGETEGLVGLYPFAPLHDMRRALQTLDPRVANDITKEKKALVRDAILQAFYALRETFLEELDLEEPQHPLLVAGSRRLKTPGAAVSARVMEEHQRKKLGREPSPRPDIDTFLAKLRDQEETGGEGRATPSR
ncbi:MULTISPECIES: hypothetical protein [unclassified Hyphomicrobium]|uniref:hypothetical protein n=1 Tax=unclassified Hyphomicrobium TaxID=2619925 RepID=UPI000213EBC6|nr:MULTISPECIES: hypothetical protein [unclassified Hyphomicrobium]CCB67851.1 conserved protein of unknown function [Hyphomicrobium sp. MC1]